jgi:hydroxysqualene dehydroxylase
MYKNIAIVGGGWSGLSAAHTLAKNPNLNIDLFESSSFLGGRARKIAYQNYTFDNGQHLLVGAYQNTLNIIKDIWYLNDASFNLDKIFHIHDIQWHVYANLKQNKQHYVFNQLNFSLPKIHMCCFKNYLNAYLSISLFYSTLSWKKRFHFIRIMHSLKWHNYQIPHNQPIKTVADWYTYVNMPIALAENFFTPLCLATLNTPVDKASIKCFFAIIQATLASGKTQYAQLYVPKYDLTHIFVDPMLAYFKHHAEKRVNIHLSTPIYDINDLRKKYDAIIIATPYYAMKKIVNCLSQSSSYRLGLSDIHLPDMQYMPITTLYVFSSVHLDDISHIYNIPFLIYENDVIFQKENSIWAIVCSAQYLNDDEAKAKLNHYQKIFGAIFYLIKRICEKRATHASTPNKAIINAHLHANIFLAGDYLHPSYPATLESAVIAGQEAAQAVLNYNQKNNYALKRSSVEVQENFSRFSQPHV